MAPLTSGGSSPDLSAFLAQAGKVGTVSHGKGLSIPSSPAPRLVIPGAGGPPDTYQPTLPFGSAGSQQAAGGGASRIALPGSAASSSHQRSIAYSVAGGLLLCVLGAGAFTVNRRRPFTPGLESDDDPTGADGGGWADGTYRRGARAAGMAEVAPASVAAKAAARAAALAAAQSNSQPASATVRLVRAEVGTAASEPAPPVTTVEGAVAPVGVSTSDSGAGRVDVPAAADPAPPVAAAGPTGEDRPDPSERPDPWTRAPWRESADRAPTVDEAVDYFRLLSSASRAEDGAAAVEVPAPAG